MMSTCSFSAQVVSENYILSRQMLNASGCNYIDNVVYYDNSGPVLLGTTPILSQRSIIPTPAISLPRQLTKVEDATGNATGFTNGASQTNEYTYDHNGNLTKRFEQGCNQHIV